MSDHNPKLTRRHFLKGAAAATGVLVASAPGVSFAQKASTINFLRQRAQVEPITILINDSP